jgi:hypothetical protein
MNWFLAHWQDVLAIYGALVGVASIIVKLTPSQTDDALLTKAIGLLNFLSTVNPKPTKLG